MTRVHELRSRYAVFHYERFELERSSSSVTARFRFSIPPDIAFAPEVIFESVEEPWHKIPEESLHNAVFHLGLIESFSYWKATASPVIEVHPAGLSEEQISWWEDLLVRGMGEFFFRNQIDFTTERFVKITSMPNRSRYEVYRGELTGRTLLTIGGGRDSALAAALLRDSGHPFTCMMLNP